MVLSLQNEGDLADYFESVMTENSGRDGQKVANWITTILVQELHEADIPVAERYMCLLIHYLQISGRAGMSAWKMLMLEKIIIIRQGLTLISISHRDTSITMRI